MVREEAAETNAHEVHGDMKECDRRKVGDTNKADRVVDGRRSWPPRSVIRERTARRLMPNQKAVAAHKSSIDDDQVRDH